MSKDIYDFGKCENCGEYTVLKNRYCVKCDEIGLPDILKDFFRRKNNNES